MFDGFVWILNPIQVLLRFIKASFSFLRRWSPDAIRANPNPMTNTSANTIVEIKVSSHYEKRDNGI